MLIEFFFTVRRAGVPATIRELLDLLGLLDAKLVFADWDDFYLAARMTLVKNEAHYDRFDRAFSSFYKGIEALDGVFGEVPRDWLAKQMERHLSEEDKRQIEALGGFEKLMETLKQRLAEQQKRHQGGSKWIGTAGTSPFGAYGYNPEGVRIGQDRSRHRRAVKVWDKREFKDLDGDVEINTRSIKIALRKLRQFARQGAADELDLEGTIHGTARNAGYLDLILRPERRNAVKVLMLLDIGGSMDDHVRQVEELFSATRSEFKNLKHFYFHNCVYESLWESNVRRFDERIPTLDVLNTYGPDWKLVIVGDATMSPYEIAYPGGANEHWNEEAGYVWLNRLTRHFRHNVWLNPQPRAWWRLHQSIGMIHELFEGRMFALSLEGLDAAIKELS